MLSVQQTSGSFPGSVTNQLLTLREKKSLSFSAPVFLSLKWIDGRMRFHLVLTINVPVRQDQVSQGEWNQEKEEWSEMGFRHPGLPRLMGNPREFSTSPHIRPSSNAGSLVHYLQQTQWNHFRNETLSSPAAKPEALLSSLPHIPHSSHFLPLLNPVQNPTV
jgi:hypothetical protein